MPLHSPWGRGTVLFLGRALKPIAGSMLKHNSRQLHRIAQRLNWTEPVLVLVSPHKNYI